MHDVLSYVYLGIYWNNHHHLLHTVERIDGAIMWANLHLLFWLSVVPFTTARMGTYPRMPEPAALYGCSLLMAAIAYTLLVRAIIAEQPRFSGGRHSRLREYALFAAVAVIWLIPDRRISRRLDDGKS